MVLQLVAIGYVLRFIFSLNNPSVVSVGIATFVTAMLALCWVISAIA
ncbi:MAG TPA: hypothetical protein VFR21_26700 [Bradyrhizobium sp.]|jgi:ABC-type iron transport system FetAB permease component|nr:hypothetical protein [Bradyrhizobium sp.]